MTQAPKWISLPMKWTRFSYGDAETYPPCDVSVLWMDEIEGMVVGKLERGSHDIIVDIGAVIIEAFLENYEEDEEEDKLEKYQEDKKNIRAEVFDPLAWMPLPSPPMTIIDHHAAEESVLRTSDIINELEPILRNLIYSKLTEKNNAS